MAGPPPIGRAVEPAASMAVAAAGKPRFCRAAVLGLAGLAPVLFFLILMIPLYFMADVRARHSDGGQTMPQGAAGSLVSPLFVLMPLIGMIWMTIFGIVAIVRIRRSRGQLRGLWLAVFDTVLFPAVALVLLLFAS